MKHKAALSLHHGQVQPQRKMPKALLLRSVTWQWTISPESWAAETKGVQHLYTEVDKTFRVLAKLNHKVFI